MPATRSQYAFTAILAALSVGSIVYTLRGGDIGTGFVEERQVESQHSIDSLTDDVGRLMKSISNWKSFCEDPYAYIRSASVHGSFTIAVKDNMNREEILALSQIERDALARCSYTKAHPQSAQFRLCVSVNEASKDTDKGHWFDQSHLFELNVQFREAGSRLLTNCNDIVSKRVEVQSYFSAYTADTKVTGIRRVSGGIRIPLENGGQRTF